MSGNLIAGLLQGVAQARQLKLQNERQAQQDKLQQSYMDTQKKLLDVKLQQQKSGQAIINAIMQGAVGGAPSGPPTVENAAKLKQSSNLIDMLSNPLVGMALGQSTGMDFMGLSDSMDRREHNKAMRERWNVQDAISMGNLDQRIIANQIAERNSRQAGTVMRTTENEGGTFEQPVDKITGLPMGQPVQVGPKKGESSETASKVALAKNAMQYIGELKSGFIGKDGKVRRDIVLKAAMPMGGVGRGRELYAKFLDALDARARAATGAAMPESEIKNYTRMYFPSPIDDDKTIKDKLNRLESFMSDYLEGMDPNKRLRGRMGSEPQTSGTVDLIYNPATGKLEPAR